MALLSNQEATEEIRRRAKRSENIFFREHATRRMNERGVDHIEVLKCLASGVVNDVPERLAVDQEWRYRMDLKLGRHSRSVVVEVILDDDLLVITVIN
jgi:hypothetical protein